MDQIGKIGRFEQGQLTTTVFGQIAKGIDGLGDKNPSRRTFVFIGNFGQSDDFIDNAGQFISGFTALDLWSEIAALIIV